MDSQIIWSPGVKLESIEKQVILTAFRFYRGNKTATANALGIAVRTLDSKLASYKELDQSDAERAANERKQREDFLARSRGTKTPDNVFTGHPGTTGVESLAVAVEGRNTEHPGGVSSESGIGKAKTDSSQQAGDDAKSGVHMESAQKSTEKQAVPMPQRKEVQSVSPKPIASSRAGGSR